MLVKGKQFLLLIRHTPRYSYIQSNLVTVFTVIEERKHLPKVIDLVLLMYTVKSSNIIYSDRGKKTST